MESEGIPGLMARRYYLSNSLEVVLISGLDKELSGVNFGLKLGSFYEPKEYLGLSKILSCTLQYIPEENGFQKIIRPTLRESNCFAHYWVPRSTETTIEFSGVFYTSCLDKYLQFVRLSIGILDYPRELVENCLKTLKKDHEARQSSDSFQRRAILNSIIDSEPRRYLLSSHDYEVSDIIFEINKFKSTFFSSGLMKLIIESSLPFDRLDSLVSTYFSDIPDLGLNMKDVKYKVGLNHLYGDQLKSSLVEFDSTLNKVSFVFVLDFQNGANIGSRRNPLFEYLVKYYFCGEFSGSLKSALFPLSLSCSVEYYADTLSFIWFDVGSESEKIVIEEVLELLYSSVLLLRNTGIEPEYMDFLRNHCIASYMNYDLLDFRLDLHERIESLINYGEWHRLGRYCKDNGLSMEEFNNLLSNFNFDNLLIFTNFAQTLQLLRKENEDEDEDYITETETYTEEYTSEPGTASTLTIDLGLKNNWVQRVSEELDDVGPSNFRSYGCKKVPKEFRSEYLQRREPFLKCYYTVRKIPSNIMWQLKRTKEPLALLNGLHRPFVNPYTPREFNLLDLSCEDIHPRTLLEVGSLKLTTKPISYFLHGMRSYRSCVDLSGDMFFPQNVLHHHYKGSLKHFHNTSIFPSENVNIWYRARNDSRQPYFKGVLSLSLLTTSFSVLNLILSVILVMSLNSILNFSLINDSRLSIRPRTGSEFSSISSSVDLYLSGYSSSLIPALESISATMNSNELISETYFFDSVLRYRAQLMNRKLKMNSVLKAKELSSRLAIPNFPTLERRLSGLNDISYLGLYRRYKLFKENLCIQGLFVGNLDRMDLENALKDFSGRFGSRASRSGCLAFFKRKDLPIKDVRGTKHKRLLYHYINPRLLELPGDSQSPYRNHSILSPASIENFLKLVNENYEQKKSPGHVFKVGADSKNFGPNVALLDVVFYFGGKNNDINTGILYLNDAYYNFKWLEESLAMASSSMSLKTSLQRFESYQRWSILLESWEATANELGLYISNFTVAYQNRIKAGQAEDFHFLRNLTVSRLKSKFSKKTIDEEFDSHWFNSGISESAIEELGNLAEEEFALRVNSLLQESLFLLIQVQSTREEHRDIHTAVNSGKYQRLKNDHGQFVTLQFTKDGPILIPSGFKYIKHVDELVQDDRIPTCPLEFDEDFSSY
ncbi:peptidase M16 [Cryptosporidium felis]|nr:peptidase M16 [Cryptosporidium felis]